MSSVPDDFWFGIEGKEVEAFRAILDQFDRAYSYETGWWDERELREFRAAHHYLAPPLMELLRMIMQRPDFPELAVKANEKNRAMLDREIPMVDLGDKRGVIFSSRALLGNLRLATRLCS